jgi:UDP-N-acetylglucosamine kinase
VPTDPVAPLTQDQIDAIYRSLIRPTLFDGSPGGEAAPTLVLLGGQPGSGKSRASARLLTEHEGMVALSGDDLRIFHPHYRELVSAQPEQAGEGFAEVTRPWVREALQDALAGRHSFLLEGTFGNPNVTLATAARFAEAEFRVRIVAIASPRVLSVVTAASRYLRNRKINTPARFTRLSAHDRGYEGTARLVDLLDAAVPVEQVTIVSRNGTHLFDRHRGSASDPAALNNAGAALHEGRHPASWGARSTMELLGELKQITNFAIESGTLTSDTAELLIEAHTLALDEVVPRLSVDADSPQARFIQRAVAEQLITLRRAAGTSPEPSTDFVTVPDRGLAPTPLVEPDRN